MNLIAALSGRRAVREYKTKAVDEQTTLHLIENAVLAPSAVNQQPWTFTVVRDQRILDTISSEAKSHMLSNMAENNKISSFQTYLKDPFFNIFYHAPLLILISAKAEGPWIVEDCSMAAENLMLSAFAIGLGTCWVGFAQNYLNTPQGKALLRIPSSWIPVAPIIVGYPKSAPTLVARKEPIIHWVG